MSDISREQIAAELNQELDELGRVERSLASMRQRLNNQLSKTTKRYAKQIDPLVEHRNKLIAEIADKANEHRSLLVEGQKKTIELRAGTIKWRMSPVSLKVDVSDDKLKQHIRMLRAAKRLFKHTVTVDMTALKKDRMIVEQLERKGAVHGERHESLVISPLHTTGEIIKTSNPHKVTYSTEK